MRRLLLACTALIAFAAATPASADIVTLGGQAWTIGGTELTLGGAPSGNQVQNTPCIICGANQPNQTNLALGFGYTDFGNTGNQSTLAYFSSGNLRDLLLGQDTISAVNYSGAQLLSVLTALNSGSTFSIGVDMNDTRVAQTLESFFFLDLTTHTILAAFSPNPLDGTLLPSTQNGTGFPDYTLNGLTTSMIDPTHQYAFFARISGANDGPDSFFLVPGVQAAVPELSTWFMMIIGFAGVGLVGMRRKVGSRPIRMISA